jgi:AraC-like DNA-binding protein
VLASKRLREGRARRNDSTLKDPPTRLPVVGYVEQEPARPLARVVRSVWIQQVGEAPYLQRNLPTGGVELHCRIGSVPRLVGPLTHALTDVLEPGTTLVGVRFQPGAAAPLLGHPASELTDLELGTDDLWGAEAVRLGEFLATASGPQAALDVLQRYLATRLVATEGPDRLVAEAVRRLMPWHPGDVGAVTTALSISESQLRRRCHATVGLGPKALHRTLRFQGFLALAQQSIATGVGSGLSELAVEAGYADQAHLSRECLRLTGLSPRTFVGEAGERCSCGHDHAVSFTSMLRSRPPAALAV